MNILSQRFFIGLLLVGMIGGAGVLLVAEEIQILKWNTSSPPSFSFSFGTSPEVSMDQKEEQLPIQTRVQDVPFAAQAPYGEWDDPVYGYGCEEAVLLMAMQWIEGKPLTKAIAKEKIADMAAFEQRQYGEFHDASLKDTARLMREYFGYTNIQVREEIDKEDIKQEIMKGNVLAVPVHGRVLNNPHYTPPGPIAHMLLVKGYDAEQGEFITHDPGTRSGADFRYDEDVFDRAIQDYPTGKDKPITEVRKIMLVIRPYDA